MSSQMNLLNHQQSTEILRARLPADEASLPVKFATQTPPTWRRAGTLNVERPADEASLSGRFAPHTPPTWQKTGAAHPPPLRRAVLMIRASRSTNSLNQRSEFESLTSLPRSLGSISTLNRGVGSSPSLHRGVGSMSTLRKGSTNSLGNLRQPLRCCCCGKSAPDDVIIPETPESPEDLHAGQRNPDGSLTPVGLAWRTLHISRAKLRAASTTSELLFGFAMIALVEVQINQPTHVPEGLFVLFSASSVLFVTVHIFALMITTYILPSIEVVTRIHPSALLEESPHLKLKFFVETAWFFSTVLGMFLFLFEVTLLSWIKFWDYAFSAALSATVFMVPAILLFVGFAVHFYHTLVVHKCDVTSNDLEQLEVMRRELETVNRKEGE